MYIDVKVSNHATRVLRVEQHGIKENGKAGAGGFGLGNDYRAVFPGGGLMNMLHRRSKPACIDAAAHRMVRQYRDLPSTGQWDNFFYCFAFSLFLGCFFFVGITVLSRPEPLFLPPPLNLFTVAHARDSASSFGTPRAS